MNLLDLPDEIFLCIFSYLEVPDLIRISRVCRRFHGLSRDPSLWRPLAMGLYDGVPGTNMLPEMYWELYRIIAETYPADHKRDVPKKRTYDPLLEIKIIKYLVEHIRIGI